MHNESSHASISVKNIQSATPTYDSNNNDTAEGCCIGSPQAHCSAQDVSNTTDTQPLTDQALLLAKLFHQSHSCCSDDSPPNLFRARDEHTSGPFSQPNRENRFQCPASMSAQTSEPQQLRNNSLHKGTMYAKECTGSMDTDTVGQEVSTNNPRLISLLEKGDMEIDISEYLTQNIIDNEKMDCTEPPTISREPLHSPPASHDRSVFGPNDSYSAHRSQFGQLNRNSVATKVPSSFSAVNYASCSDVQLVHDASEFNVDALSTDCATTVELSKERLLGQQATIVLGDSRRSGASLPDCTMTYDSFTHRVVTAARNCFSHSSNPVRCMEL